MLGLRGGRSEQACTLSNRRIDQRRAGPRPAAGQVGIVEAGAPVSTQKIKLRHGDMLVVETLPATVRLNALRRFLAEGFQAHLQVGGKGGWAAMSGSFLGRAEKCHSQHPQRVEGAARSATGVGALYPQRKRLLMQRLCFS